MLNDDFVQSLYPYVCSLTYLSQLISPVHTSFMIGISFVGLYTSIHQNPSF
jgi:hypothetical protein